MEDSAKLTESASVGVLADVHDEIKWHCHTLLEKFDEDGNLYDTVEIEGNALMNAGAGILWSRLVANTATAFSTANAAIGVGDSSGSPSDATKTDLVATTNKIRKTVNAGYPDLSTSGPSGAIFQSTFGSTEANWVWNEWGVFNATSGGVMLNRKVQALGTKASGTTWQLTVTLSLA